MNRYNLIKGVILFILVNVWFLVAVQWALSNTRNECEKIKDDIEHYTSLERCGVNTATSKQLQIWKKFRIDAIARYNYLGCNSKGK